MSRVRNYTFYHALGRCQTQLAAHALYHRHSHHLNNQPIPVPPLFGLRGQQI